MTPPDPDVDLDKAVIAKARDGLARARSRLAKAADGEAKAAAQKSVEVWDALLRKSLVAPHQAKARKQERGTMWAALRHLTDVAEEHGRSLQQVQTGLQQVQAGVQSLASAVEAEKADREDVRQAVGGFRADPSGAALALLAKHRAADVAKEQRNLESATAKWETKRQALAADVARRQKVLDRFHHELDVEPDDGRRRALTVKLTEWMTEHMAAMDKLSEHYDARPH